MHFQAAAILLQRGLPPQDYEALAEEFDLLAVGASTLHDPETAGEDPGHLEEILSGDIVWVPGAVPYGNLWRDLKTGTPARSVQLCAVCFPPNS